MSDIVERLVKAYDMYPQDATELRAEIERLRAALRGALAMVEDFAGGAGFSTSGRAEFEDYRRALEGK